MLAGAMVLIGAFAVGLVVMLALRSATFAEARTEAHLHEPGVHRLTYPVPAGQDPAVLTAALKQAGFTACADLEQGQETLLVEVATEADRLRVREVLEHVTRSGFEGVPMKVAHVRFDDEP